jgi:virginiamycin B lyase
MKAAAVVVLLLIAASARAQVAEFPLAPNSSPGGITAGPDGNVWFTQRATQSIGRITPGGAVSVFPVGKAEPEEIVAGPDGRLWYTAFLGDGVGSVDPLAADVAASVTEITVTGSGSRPDGIAVGSDGALWFTQARSDQIGRLTTGGALTNEFAPSGRIPLGIVAAGDELWFTLFDSDQIGRIGTGGALGPVYDLPAGSRPQSIVVGPDGALWFTAPGRHAIGRLTVDGVASEFPLEPGSQPNAIVSGPDGALWFTLFEADRIGRITTAGEIGGVDLPNPDSGPDDITVGPDGNLWFTETLGSRIGRMAAALPTTTTTTTLPGGCAPSVTLASLACRLGELATRLQAEVGAFQPKLAKLATAARTQLGTAESRCTAGRARPAKRALKKAVRQVGTVVRRLRAKRTSRQVPPAIVEALVATGTAIIADVRALRATLACTAP